jgi:hypothetical protein
LAADRALGARIAEGAAIARERYQARSGAFPLALLRANMSEQYALRKYCIYHCGIHLYEYIYIRLTTILVRTCCHASRSKTSGGCNASGGGGPIGAGDATTRYVCSRERLCNRRTMRLSHPQLQAYHCFIRKLDTQYPILGLTHTSMFCSRGGLVELGARAHGGGPFEL